MKIPTSSSTVGHNFYLKGDDSFNDRQKSVFEGLDRLSPRGSETQGPPPRRTVTPKPLRADLNQFKGRESIFKRPDLPRPRRILGKVPDFVKNPHKWKKYSLEDVETVSDRSNAAAAAAFFKTIEKTKTEEEKREYKKILFNRHAALDAPGDAEATTSEPKPYFLNGRYTMPEYVVGSEKRTVKKRTKPNEGVDKAAVKIKLSHLIADEE